MPNEIWLPVAVQVSRFKPVPITKLIRDKNRPELRLAVLPCRLRCSQYGCHQFSHIGRHASTGRGANSRLFAWCGNPTGTGTYGVLHLVVCNGALLMCIRVRLRSRVCQTL